MAQLHCFFSVGSGIRVSFWHDKWKGDTPFKDKFPLLFIISNSPNCSVADCWGISTNSWKFTSRRHLKYAEIIELTSLLEVLNSTSLSLLEDKIKWGLDSSGIFSARSLSRYLENGHKLPKKLLTALWKTGGPKKINVLSWILLFGNLNTSDILQKKQASWHLQPSLCILCSAK